MFSCPVYNAELTEPNSPRGKVNLIKAIRDGRLEQNKLNRDFIYQCMLCGSCEHICTKGVEFTDMMVDYRVKAAEGKKIPFLKKLILMMYQSVLFKKMTGVTDLLAKTPLKKKLTIPRRRKANLKKLLSRKPEQDHYDILFFPGCVTSMFYPEIIKKTVSVLRENGFSVAVPKGLECCGFPYLSQGWKEKFTGFRETNKKIFTQYNFKYLVVPCGTGVMTFKDYYGFDGKKIKIFELTEFFRVHLPDLQVKTGEALNNKGEGKITWHDPCHSLKSLGIKEAPRHFMKQLGDDFADDDSALCCGFGGVFSVGFPSTSEKIFKRKEERLKELGADTVVTSCPGCYLQLREKLSPGKDVKFFIDLF